MWLEEKVHKILDFVCVLQEVDWFGYCIVVGPEAGVQKRLGYEVCSVLQS